MTIAAYTRLKERFAQLRNLDNARNILGKDMETVMRPGSAQDRISQMMAIDSAAHHLISEPVVQAWLEEAESRADTLPQDDQRNLALMRREWIHAAGLPADLAREKSRVEAEGQHIHVSHYKGGDWNAVKDWYAHSFKISREVGTVKKEKLNLPTAYDALLDEFSPGLRYADVQREFAALDTQLRVMIPRAMEHQKSQPAPLPLTGTFDFDSQMKLNQMMAEAIGFDTDRGVLHLIKGHPSSTGSSDDVRITTRCFESDPLNSFYTTAHEVGHAMYDQNQPVAWRYQPAGHHLGLVVHESQSMIIQLQACMTREFMNFLALKVQEIFNRKNDPCLSADNLRRLTWRANPSFIRVNADELTYPMHILLRTDLEQKIVSGSLEVSDLPDAWNEGMVQRLGIKPSNHADGCMQDIHWPIGAAGYFPDYLLGAMGAAQLFAAALRADSSILPSLGQGNFRPLKEWLVRHVHSRGSLVTSDRMFHDATGSSLSSRDYIAHLSSRFLAA